MAIENYTDLKTAAQNWAARTDSEFTNRVDEFIDLTEAWLKRKPERPERQKVGGVRANKQRATGTLTTGTITLALPSDFNTPDHFELTADPASVVTFLPPQQIDVWHRSGKGKPRFYTIQDVIEFDVAPESDYAYEFSYWPTFTALDDTNTTNWVITNFPDVYLAGVMFHASRFVQDGEGAVSWLQQYKDAAWGASAAYAEGRRPQAPLETKLDIDVS